MNIEHINCRIRRVSWGEAALRARVYIGNRLLTENDG